MKNIKNIIGSSPKLIKTYETLIAHGASESEAIRVLIGCLTFQIEWDKDIVEELKALIKPS